jgi:hypothetical protein
MYAASQHSTEREQHERSLHRRLRLRRDLFTVHAASLDDPGRFKPQMVSRPPPLRRQVTDGNSASEGAT